MRILVILLLSLFILSCNSSNIDQEELAETNENSSKNEGEAIPLKDERVQNNKVVSEWYEKLIAYQDEKEHPDEFIDAFIAMIEEEKPKEEWVMSRDFHEKQLKYELHELNSTQFIAIVTKGGGCSAISCMFSYAAIFVDKYNGIEGLGSFGTEDYEDGARIKVVGKGLVVVDTKLKYILKNNEEHSKIAKFSRGIEPLGDEDIREIYAFMEGEFIELRKAPKSILNIARNSIYAVKGFRFKSQKLQNYFAQYDWYQPKHQESEDLLTDYEKSVAETILEWEQTS